MPNHQAGLAADPDRPLPVAGFKGTPEEIERQWYDEVYRGRGDSMAQLTWRAVLMGSALGGVLSLTNLYIGLKAGWGFGVAITASILSYAIWASLLKVGLAKVPMTILENNCMQSTASSAGYSTGGTLVSAFAAYIIVNDQSMSVPLMLAWVFFIAVLGVTMAIPMKRQMINIEQLRFPSGRGGGRDPARAACDELEGHASRQGAGRGRARCGVGQVLGRGPVDHQRQSGALLERRHPDRPAEVAAWQSLRGLVRPHRRLHLGFHFRRRRRHHRHARVRHHAGLGHACAGPCSCRFCRPTASSRVSASPPSCNGRCGSAPRAWWPRGC